MSSHGSIAINKPAKKLVVAPHIRFLQHEKEGRILLDVKAGKCFSLNSTGSRIWDAVEKNQNAGVSYSEIVQTVADACQVPAEQIERDIVQFTEQLESKGVLVAADDLPNKIQSQGLQFTSKADLGSVASTDPCSHSSTPWPDPKAEKGGLYHSLFALALLVVADAVLKASGLRGLYSFVGKFKIRTASSRSTALTGRICAAVDRATRWYLKPAWCLQRSAVTACILRFMELAHIW
jgi:hypothetical protein